MEIPWYDIALALILVGSAIAFAGIGTMLVRRHTRKVNDLIRAEMREEWRREWLVGKPAFYGGGKVFVKSDPVDDREMADRRVFA